MTVLFLAVLNRCTLEKYTFLEYYTRETVKNTQRFEEITGSTRIETQENITTEHLRNNYREYAKSAHLGLVLYHVKSLTQAKCFIIARIKFFTTEINRKKAKFIQST